MFSQETIKGFVDFVTEDLAVYLLPVMLFAFFSAIVLRILVHYTVTRELWFAKEFYKRIHEYLDNKSESTQDLSFSVGMKRNLERTYYELFVVRAYMKRRNPDYVMDLTDRVFLIQEGCARLVKETMRQVKHLKYSKERPRFIELTKNIFDNNPCFKKIMGVLPVQVTHDALSILPGIFIIGGIFGTFLGIMAALPELGNMSLDDVEGAKTIMDNFLKSIAFSMSTSIIGIILSVSMTVINTLLDPEKVFMKTINKFENTMELLWDSCENNILSKDIPDFNEHRDPIEALAEDAVQSEIDSERTFSLNGLKNLKRPKKETSKETPVAEFTSQEQPVMEQEHVDTPKASNEEFEAEELKEDEVDKAS